MTVLGASGVFLDYHAIEAGLFRKEGTPAFGTIQAEAPNDNYSIPAGSLFGTDNGIYYAVDAATVFPSKIQIARDVGTKDYLTDLYKTVVSSGLFYDALLSLPITGSAYTFTGTTITWLDTGLLGYGVSYFLATTGNVTLNIPVTCTIDGVAGNTAADTITVNVDSLLVNSMTNETSFLNGVDDETDEDLRYRVLQARRKSFTLGRINDMISQHEGVEDSRTYQNTAVDKTTLTDWNVATGLTDYMKILSTGTYGFSFYPSGGIGTLQGVTMYAKVSGNALPLNFAIRYHASGVYYDSEQYDLDKVVIDRGVLIGANESEWQDIYIPLQVNGLDYTKTYRVYIQSTEEATTDMCWMMKLTGSVAEGDYRLDHFSGNESITPSGYVFKTHYGNPSFTVSVRPKAGVEFTDIQEELEDMLNYVDGGGYSPICIQGIVQEATKIYLGLYVTITIDRGYTFTDVSSRIKSNLNIYLATLHPGDDIIYSQIERIILNTNGVKRDRGLKINANAGTWVDNTMEIDLPIGENEYVELDETEEYDGVTIIEG
jgi:uncharacterized phage protein gp47/JayE